MGAGIFSSCSKIMEQPTRNFKDSKWFKFIQIQRQVTFLFQDVFLFL